MLELGFHGGPHVRSSASLAAVRTLHGRLVFERRVQVLAKRLAAMIPQDASVLDVGCGDGRIDALLASCRPDIRIQGIDVLERPHSHVPVSLFDGRTIPLDDRSFDVVLFVDVLHHTEDPEILLKEARRVSANCVVVKDHCADGFLAVPTLRFMDWVGNAPHGVVLPYNYWPEARWIQAFSSLSFIIQEWTAALKLYPWPFSIAFDRRLHFIARLTAR